MTRGASASAAQLFVACVAAASGCVSGARLGRGLSQGSGRAYGDRNGTAPLARMVEVQGGDSFSEALTTAVDFVAAYASDESSIPLPPCATSNSILTEANIRALLLEANMARAGADPFRPVGTDPLPMQVWDCDLEDTAQQYANAAVAWEHSSSTWRSSLYGSQTGENLAIMSSTGDTLTQASIDTAGDGWHEEEQWYTYGASVGSSGECVTGQQCGHYTQQIWRESTKIGCGARFNTGFFGSQYPFDLFLVCHYHCVGNWLGESPMENHDFC